MKAQPSLPLQILSLRPLTAFVAISFLSFTPAFPAADDGYIVHEWGTFTSIQGSDGVLLDWNGIATGDLPEFIYNWSRPGLQRFDPTILIKSSLTCLQRMETPVIYFYPDQPMRVDVTVEFPKGKITEWFPQARHVGPSTGPLNPLRTGLDNAAAHIGTRPNPTFASRFGEQPITNSVIHWNDFDLVPAGRKPELANRMPTSKKASHYFAARETEAAFVRVEPMEESVTAPEIEKFLFYRGVGNFQTPLKVTIGEHEQIKVANTGGAPLKHLFALAVHGNRASFVPLGDLETSQTRETRLEIAAQGLPLNEAVNQLGRQMADALEAEGLYRAEAEAMVKIWHDAWFEEPGVRVLYVLPQAWTDQILPITLEPKPRELVRVMVGRSELITPGMEIQIRDCVAHFRQSNPVSKQEAIRQFQALNLGRFATAAIRFVSGRPQDLEFLKDASALLQAATQLQPAAPPQAARRSAETGG